MNIYEKLSKLRQAGEPAILITTVDKRGKGPTDIGKKMLVAASGRSYGSLGGVALDYYAKEKCTKLIVERRSVLINYVLDADTVVKEAIESKANARGYISLFYEYVEPIASIFIFGGGHVGQELTKILKSMNYYITVIDDRASVIQTFRGADRKVHSNYIDFIEKEGIPQGSYVVVCTPSRGHEYNVLLKVLELELKPKYIGILSSESKLKGYLGKPYNIHRDGTNVSYFYGQMGQNSEFIKPEEIAISIASELLAVQHNKQGYVGGKKKCIGSNMSLQDLRCMI